MAKKKKNVPQHFRPTYVSRISEVVTAILPGYSKNLETKVWSNLTFFKESLFYVILDSSGRPNQDKSLSPRVPLLHNQPQNTSSTQSSCPGHPRAFQQPARQPLDKEMIRSPSPSTVAHCWEWGQGRERQRGNAHEQEKQRTSALQTPTQSPG